MSTGPLITTISESIGSEPCPPDYHESLSSQVILCDEHNHKNDKPPSYDYLYNKPTYYSNLITDIFKQIFTKEHMLIALVFISLVIHSMNIWIGQRFRYDCPLEPNIPAWLMIHSIGIIILIVNTLILMKWKMRRNVLLGFFMGILLIMWLVRGEFIT